MAVLQSDEPAQLNSIQFVEEICSRYIIHIDTCVCSKLSESRENPVLAKSPTSAALGAHPNRKKKKRYYIHYLFLPPLQKLANSNKRNSRKKIMGRLHSNGKGISASAIPYSRTPPAWLKVTPDQVVDQICKLAKKGATPSQIGVVLRDSHGVAQVKVVTGEFFFPFREESNLYFFFLEWMDGWERDCEGARQGVGWILEFWSPGRGEGEEVSEIANVDVCVTLGLGNKILRILKSNGTV